MKRAKRTQPANNALNLTKSQADAVALLIATQVEAGTQAFVVAGAEILRSEYGFTEGQAGEWATKAVRLGGKYLRVAGNKYEARPLDVRGTGQ